jgi:hypothetical protein
MSTQAYLEEKKRILIEVFEKNVQEFLNLATQDDPDPGQFYHSHFNVKTSGEMLKDIVEELENSKRN